MEIKEHLVENSSKRQEWAGFGIEKRGDNFRIVIDLDLIRHYEDENNVLVNGKVIIDNVDIEDMEIRTIGKKDYIIVYTKDKTIIYEIYFILEREPTMIENEKKIGFNEETSLPSFIKYTIKGGKLDKKERLFLKLDSNNEEYKDVLGMPENVYKLYTSSNKKITKKDKELIEKLIMKDSIIDKIKKYCSNLFGLFKNNNF